MTDLHSSATMTAAVSAALADPGPDDGALLRSIVRLTRAIFSAGACSVLLLDEETGELVFEAVAGDGEEFLVGTRFAADRGVAGWVLASGEPVATDDLGGTHMFARDLAERTGYVPGAIMVVPVVYAGAVLGVLEVLDPKSRHDSHIADLDLLLIVGEQAGISLRSLARARSAQHALAHGGADYEGLAALVQLLDRAQPDQRAAGLRLVSSLHDILRCSLVT